MTPVLRREISGVCRGDREEAMVVDAPGHYGPVQGYRSSEAVFDLRSRGPDKEDKAVA